MESFYNIKAFKYYRRLMLWSHIIFPLRDIPRKQGSNTTGAFPRKQVIRIKKIYEIFLKTCLDSSSVIFSSDLYKFKVCNKMLIGQNKQ